MENLPQTPQPKMNLSPLFLPTTVLVLIFVVYVVSDLMRENRVNDTLSGKEAHNSLIGASNSYFEISRSIENATSCFPLNVDRRERTVIQFLHCSEYAYVRDGQGTTLKEHFEVPSELARRYNFWRRVYSLWSIDQYVIHSSEFPEVVFEIIDVTGYQKFHNEARRQQIARNIVTQRRREYRALLNEMHRNRHLEEFEHPAMQRIARYTRHISDPNKYQLLANSLRMQRGQMEFIETGLKNSGRYMKAIRQEFINQGIPVELSYLAFIESSFNLNAHSRVGASGIFQIMPATGRQYMIVTDDIDERKDPIKSGRAAARLLKFYYDLLDGHWPLAITAYNHGVGGIRRAVRSTGSNDIAHIVYNYNGRAFGFASKNFYSGFLGMLATLMEEDIIFPGVEKYEPLNFETYRVRNPTSVGYIKSMFGLSDDVLLFYNPDLSRRFVRANGRLPRNYELKYPAPIEEEKTEAVVKAVSQEGGDE